MMPVLTRRESLAAIGLTAGAALLPTLWTGDRGCFLYEAKLDPQGQVAARMTGAGWTLVPINGRADALLHRFAADAAVPNALAGLTTAATRFVFEQVARRRGMQNAAAVGPVWALALPTHVGTSR